MILELFMLICSFFGLFCVYGMRCHSYFNKTVVKYIKPPVPFFGNGLKLYLGMESGTEWIKNIYNSFPDQKYIGLFDNFAPVILLRDLDVIKQITIKNFENFHDRMIFFNEDVDLIGKSLSQLQGSKWKDMRTTLSPAFSSSKIRKMFTLIEKCSKRLSDLYLKEPESQKKNVIEVEVKEIFSKYTLDVILTTACGLEVDTLNEENVFYKVCKSFLKFSKSQMITVFFLIYVPQLAKFLGLKFISSDAANFFKDVIISTMENREKNKIHRPDVIQILMDVKRGSIFDDVDTVKDVVDEGFASAEEFSFDRKKIKPSWDDDYITAQVFAFFAAGFDTTSIALSWFFYEMAHHPEIQNKLQKEIDDMKNKRGDGFNYYDLLNMKYLDMCISETLRLWPFLGLVDRMCTKDFELPPPSENSSESHKILKDQLVYIPIYAIHTDPKYFPDPEIFDPERFSDENKSSIQSGSYLPFGLGPRNCIGSRYALLVLKSVIFNILVNFDVVITKKTDVPMTLESNPFLIKPGKNGVWLGLKRRIN